MSVPRTSAVRPPTDVAADERASGCAASADALIVVGLVLARVLASALGEAPAAGLGALLVFWWYFGQWLRARGESPRVAWTLGAVYGALTAAFITGATILS